MEYKGDLKEFPQEVVEWMCDQQEAQGNKRDVSVFEKDKKSNKEQGGFDWIKADDDIGVDDFSWDIILSKNFDLFFKHFPKKENINDILEECKRRFPKGSKVFSPMTGDKFKVCLENTFSNNDIHFTSGTAVMALLDDGMDCNALYYNGKYATLVEEEQEQPSGLQFMFEEKEEEQDYPKVMWCWDDDVSECNEWLVIGKLNDFYMGVSDTYKDKFNNELKSLGVFNGYINFFKNASLTKPVKEYTREQALKEFNINIVD